LSAPDKKATFAAAQSGRGTPELQSTGMDFIDKNNALDRISTMPYVVVELGCGNSKVKPEAIGIDMVDQPAVDIIANAEHGLDFLEDACVDELHSYHFLEHLNDTGQIFSEIYRVLKPGGKCIGAVPHFSNPYYYSDYTHRRFFGLYSFAYFSKKQTYMRRVPGFYNELDFRATRIKLVFYSPFKLINVFRKIYILIFNLSPFMQEMYESSFTGIFPVHEIVFELEKV
jgi:predicted SAM-dependent methyltransferase